MDFVIYNILVVTTLTVVCSLLLLALARALSRSRPDLKLTTAWSTAFVVRLVAAAGIAATGFARSVRGGDEILFLSLAEDLAETRLDDGAWALTLVTDFHVLIFGAMYRVFGTDVLELAIRIPMITLSVAGLMLISAAVYDLAGRKAAHLAAWLLALEPAGVFFGSLLHKEPPLFLAEGLVAYGGARMWRRGSVAALLPMAAGCALAASVRPYASWLLVAACAAITLHAALRAGRGRTLEQVRAQRARGIVLAAVVVVLGGLTAPAVLSGTSEESLATLQRSQDANARDNANLTLGRVDYSTRGNVVRNLPLRMRDLILRPYPWQLSNRSQQFGLLGTLVVWPCLLIGGVLLWTQRRRVIDQTGPLLYLGAFVLVTYALSAGNAGTAFRYRTHLVGLILAVTAVLWTLRRERLESRAATATSSTRTGPRAAPGYRLAS